MLFADAAVNLLPYDGIVNDYGICFAPAQADAYLARLQAEIPWQCDVVVLYGKRIVAARQTAWLGDHGITYTYSGVTRAALPWQDSVLAIKAAVEARVGASFNSCLLNYYADGSQGMSWHSDDEKELGETPLIASVSLGAARKFAFKHKRSAEKRELLLAHGQLIVMRGDTQRHWRHAIMKSTRVQTPRISLTFRTIIR